MRNFLNFQSKDSNATHGALQCGVRVWINLLSVLVCLSLVFIPVNGRSDIGPFQFPTEPTRTRSVFFPALSSFFLPGLDQWWEGQYPYAPIYSLGALSGVLLTQGSFGVIDNPFDPTVDELTRTFGTTLYLSAGGISLYQSFRSAAETQKQHGKYLFLKENESPEDLALAPFQFQHLGKLTTAIPLGLAIGLVALSQSEVGSRFTAREGAYAFSASYSAGVWEEAAFRGWMMPMLREWMGSDFYSNATTAVLFGAAHLNSVPVPIVQTLLGYYFGSVSQSRNWTLSEVIFIHTWWDIIIFTGSFAKSQIDSANSGKNSQRTLWLPLFMYSF